MSVVTGSAAILFLIAFQIGLDILQKLLSFDNFSFFTQLDGVLGFAVGHQALSQRVFLIIIYLLGIIRGLQSKN